MKLEREFKEVFDFYSQGNDKNNQYISFDDVSKICQKVKLDIDQQELKEQLAKIND